MTGFFSSKKVLLTLMLLGVGIGIVVWRFFLPRSPEMMPVHRTIETVVPSGVPFPTVQDYTHDGVVDERDKALIRDHE